jgi:hypothetical protein
MVNIYVFLEGAAQVSDGSEKYVLFQVTTGEDAPSRLPLPPHTPSACSRQERTGLSERQRSARTRGSHAELTDLGLPPHGCTVGIALALHSVITQQMKLRQGCKHALMQQQCSSRNAQVHTHTHTHMHRRTHAQAHTRTDTHTHAHMHRRTHAHKHTHIHTHTHTHALATHDLQRPKTLFSLTPHNPAG